MEGTHIPAGAWMRLRQHGRYAFAKNSTPIVWRSTAPKKGTVVYVIGWRNGQQQLTASSIITL